MGKTFTDSQNINIGINTHMVYYVDELRILVLAKLHLSRLCEPPRIEFIIVMSSGGGWYERGFRPICRVVAVFLAR